MLECDEIVKMIDIFIHVIDILQKVIDKCSELIDISIKKIDKFLLCKENPLHTAKPPQK
jgi:hypothetical protein